MARAIFVSPDGIQHTQDVPTPVPFSFEQDVLGDGPFNARIAGALIELVMRDLFPDPATPALFTWDKLSPTMVMTIASAYHILNEKNAQHLQVGQVLPVSDDNIKARIARRGVLTPHEIAEGKHRGPQRRPENELIRPSIDPRSVKK